MIVESDHDDHRWICNIIDNWEYYLNKNGRFATIPLNFPCIQADFLYGVNPVGQLTGFDKYATFAPLGLLRPSYRKKYRHQKQPASGIEGIARISHKTCYVRDDILAGFVENFRRSIRKVGNANWPLKCVSTATYTDKWLDDPTCPFLTPNEYFRLEFIMSLLIPETRIEFLKKFIRENFPPGPDNWIEWSAGYKKPQHSRKKRTIY